MYYYLVDFLSLTSRMQANCHLHYWNNEKYDHNQKYLINNYKWLNYIKAYYIFLVLLFALFYDTWDIIFIFQRQNEIVKIIHRRKPIIIHKFYKFPRFFTMLSWFILFNLRSYINPIINILDKVLKTKKGYGYFESITYISWNSVNILLYNTEKSNSFSTLIQKLCFLLIKVSVLNQTIRNLIF